LAPDETPPNPYAGSTYSNTHPAWLQNAQGALNADVEANLDDLKGFSANLDEIQGNFAELGRGVAEPMRSSVAGAFPTGGDHGLEWEAVMNSLGVYNAFQFQTFVANLALGIKNVASAASAVANSYANTDDTSAANMAAIDFAFGDHTTSSIRPSQRAIVFASPDGPCATKSVVNRHPTVYRQSRPPRQPTRGRPPSTTGANASRPSPNIRADR